MEQNNAIEIVKQMVADRQVAQEVVEKYFPELKEEYREDKMREMAIKAVHAPEAQSCIKSWGVEPDDVISWLEDRKYNSLMKCLRFANAKIGELVEENYKLRENQPVKKTIELGKTYKCVAAPRYTLFKKGDEYKSKDVFLAELMELCSDCFKLVEEDAEPVENKRDVEETSQEIQPKFKEGDWVMNTDNINCANSLMKIQKVTKNEYLCSYNNGQMPYSIEYIDKTCHLWTIKDAKDGDILVDGNKPFIFKRRDSLDRTYAYCGITEDDSFIIEPKTELGEWTWMNDLKPATLGYRQILFSKMKDAGYMWNSSVKKLIKTKEKLDEDLNNMRFRRCLSYIEATGNPREDDVEWFKNLWKNYWKPSSEQLDALKEVVEKPYNPPHGYVDTRLESLYDDLKKLVE